MKITVVTDEISADLETALELAAELGLHDIELRGYGTERVPRFTGYQKTRVRELLDEYQAQVVAISPGLFKIPPAPTRRERFPLQVLDSALYQRWHDARSLMDFHLQELLPASIQYAGEIGAQKIICFSFERGPGEAGPAPDEILECLTQAAEATTRAGLELLIEVEAGFWADTGRHTAELLRKIGNPALGVNWDPGNTLLTGEIPFPEGYQAVQEYVRHIHFKDVQIGGDGEIRYCLLGELDWEGQMRALQRDQYSGYISIEPHLEPKVASVRKMCARLKMLIEMASASIHP